MSRKNPLTSKPQILPHPDKNKRLTRKLEPIDFQAPDLTMPSLPELPRKFRFRYLFIPLIIVIVLIFLIVSALSYWYLSSFSQAAGVTPQQLIQSASLGLNLKSEYSNSKVNFLVLGTDSIVGQKENSKLTDTILVISFDLNSHTITLFSLPRDLWIDPLKTKINALYYYGELNQPSSGAALTTSVVQEITGVPINYSMIINLQSLEQIINTVGGVDIEVPETFTDDKFPKSDVDVTKVKDEALLYETITFEKGLHHFDGITALKYIRSRHSQNQIEGNDQARNQRQQQLIQAIISKIKSKSVISNPNILGNLYKILRQELNLPLNDEQLIALIKANGLKFPSIKSFSLPIADDKEQGLIYHPSALIYGQWVFQPIDPTWNQIKNFVSQEL